MSVDDIDICKETAKRMAAQLLDYEKHQAIGILSAILAEYAVALDNIENEGRGIVLKAVEDSYYGLLKKMRSAKANVTRPLPRESIPKGMISQHDANMTNDAAIQIIKEMTALVDHRLKERLQEIGVNAMSVQDGDMTCLRSYPTASASSHADYYYHTTFLMGIRMDNEGFEFYDEPQVRPIT